MKLESDREIPFDKFHFYFQYFFQKFIKLPFTVYNPRWRFYLYDLYEIIYSTLKFFDRKKKMYPYPFMDNKIETKFGSFYIRPRTTDAVVVSPAYEYLDKQFLKNIVESELSKNKKVMFIDVGSNIGVYPIYLEAYLRNKTLLSTSNILILAFEPDIYNYDILMKNLELNQSKLVNAYNLAITDKDNIQVLCIHDKQTPGCSYTVEGSIESLESGVFAKGIRLDTFLGSYLTQKIDEFSIIAKIDVEGYEHKVIDGFKKTIEQSKNLYLCIEGFEGDKRVYILVEKLHSIIPSWQFIRLTPYNFWAIKKSNTMEK